MLAKAELSRLGDDGQTWIPLAHKTTEVTTLVEELLGFKAEQFRQVVVLPQGQFRRLLAASSAEREKILETLFSTATYKRVQDALKIEAAGLRERGEKAALQRRTLLDQAGAEGVEELAERHAGLQATLASLAEEEGRARGEDAAARLALQEGQGIEARFAEAAAAAAASSFADGWRDPVILRWRALARYRVGGLQAARWQILSLAWFAADSFPELLRELAAPQLESDWRRFQAETEVPDATWFPAWCLLTQPELAAALAGEISPPLRQAAAGIRGLLAFVVLTGILAIEPGGYSKALIEERARLQAIDAGFFAAYMRSRAVGHRQHGARRP